MLHHLWLTGGSGGARKCGEITANDCNFNFLGISLQTQINVFALRSVLRSLLVTLDLQAGAALSTIKNSVDPQGTKFPTSSKGDEKKKNFMLWIFERRQRHLTEAVLAALLED